MLLRLSLRTIATWSIILDPAVGAGKPFYLWDFSGLSVISWFTYQVNARFCAKPL